MRFSVSVLVFLSTALAGCAAELGDRPSGAAVEALVTDSSVQCTPEDLGRTPTDSTEGCANGWGVLERTTCVAPDPSCGKICPPDARRDWWDWKGLDQDPSSGVPAGGAAGKRLVDIKKFQTNKKERNQYWVWRDQWNSWSETKVLAECTASAREISFAPNFAGNAAQQTHVPGFFGSMDDTLRINTWRPWGIHWSKRPAAQGFYGSILPGLDHLGFIPPDLPGKVLSCKFHRGYDANSKKWVPGLLVEIEWFAPEHVTCLAPRDQWVDGSCSGRHPSCPPAEEWTYESPGLTLEDVKAQHQNPAELTCLACDVDANGQPLTAGERYGCLHLHSQSPAEYTEPGRFWGQPSVRKGLPADIAELIGVEKKKLYQLYGHELSSEQRTDAQALFTSHDLAAPVCGELPSLAGAPACADDVMPTLESRCVNLLAASPAVASRDYLQCVGWVEALAASVRENDECTDAHVAYLNDAFALLLELHRRHLSVDGTEVELTSIPRVLHLIQRTYDALEAVAPLVDDEALVLRELNGILRGFWSRRFHSLEAANELQTLFPTHVDYEGMSVNEQEVLAQKVHRLATELAAERSDAALRLLEAVFKAPGEIQPDGVVVDTLPVRGFPLLVLLGDVLSNEVQRLDELGTAHDLACSIRTCSVDGQLTPLAEYWALLSTLDDPDAFRKALRSVTTSLDGWRPVMSTLSFHIDELARYLADERSERGAAMLAPIHHVLATAKQRITSFKKTGRFEAATHGRRLLAGLNEASVDNTFRVVNDLASRLKISQGEDRQKVLEVAASFASYLRDASSAQANLNRRAELSGQFDEVVERIEALTANVERDEIRFRDLLEASSALSLLDSGSYVRATGRGTQTWDFTGASVLAEPMRVDDLRSGMLLAVDHVAGQYAPTCALREAKFLAPGGHAGDEQPAPAALSASPTGPDGYNFQWSGSSYAAKSRTTGTNRNLSAGVRAEVCATTGIGEEITGIRASACTYLSAEWSDTLNRSKNTGDDARTTHAFAGGIQLASTPYPRFAAGSLLVVFRDSSDRDVDVVPLYPGSNMIAVPSTESGDPLTAFFQVNDSRCDNADDSHRMTIRVTPVVSELAVAEDVIRAMAGVREMFAKEYDAYEGQGTMLPSESGFLRARARLKLISDGGYRASEIPSPLLDLFDVVVSKELVAFERGIEINRLRDQQELLLMQLKAVQDELRYTALKSRASLLAGATAVEQLQRRPISAQLRSAIRVTQDYLMPVLEQRSPLALERIERDQQTSQALDGLQAMGPGAALTSAAADLASLFSGVSRLRDEVGLGERTDAREPEVVALRIPRPGSDTGMLSDHKAVAESVAELVWKAVEHAGTAQVTIRPEDLYDQNGFASTYSLDCQDASPVIEGMYVFVNRTDVYSDTPVREGFSIRVTTSETQSFATEFGPMQYVQGNPLFRSFSGVPIVTGPFDRAVGDPSVVHQRVADQSPLGITPFTTFDLHFEDAGSRGSDAQSVLARAGLDDDATELVLVMQVRSRISQPLSWVNTCAPE